MTPIELAARVCLGFEPGLHLFIERWPSGRVSLLISGRLDAPPRFIVRRSEWVDALRTAARSS